MKTQLRAALMKPTIANPKRQTDRSRDAVAIATCSAVAGKEKDDLQVIRALGERGVTAVHAAWDDPCVDWRSFSLVVIRSTWDYPERRDEFLTWAAQLHTMLNPLPVLQWNTDKHYLSDLGRAGLPVIATTFLEPGEPFEPPAWPFVVKPAVSCSAKNTARYSAGDASRQEYRTVQRRRRKRVGRACPPAARTRAHRHGSTLFVEH
jgi:hypothetical protein